MLEKEIWEVTFGVTLYYQHYCQNYQQIWKWVAITICKHSEFLPPFTRRLALPPRYENKCCGCGTVIAVAHHSRATFLKGLFLVPQTVWEPLAYVQFQSHLVIISSSQGFRKWQFSNSPVLCLLSNERLNKQRLSKGPVMLISVVRLIMCKLYFSLILCFVRYFSDKLSVTFGDTSGYTPTFDEIMFFHWVLGRMLQFFQ